MLLAATEPFAETISITLRVACGTVKTLSQPWASSSTGAAAGPHEVVGTGKVQVEFLAVGSGPKICVYTPDLRGAVIAVATIVYVLKRNVGRDAAALSSDL